MLQTIVTYVLFEDTPAVTPVRNIDHPTIGIRKFDVLLMNLNGRRKWNRLYMS